MAEKTKRKASDEMSFEQLYAALEGKARALEQGNLPLEESLTLYEEGAALAARLREILEAAELRIRTVQRGPDVDEEPPDPGTEDGGDFGEDAYE